MSTLTLPIGSTVTVRGLGGPYIVRSEPYARPYSDPAITLEGPDGYRFPWSVADCRPMHASYT